MRSKKHRKYIFNEVADILDSYVEAEYQRCAGILDEFPDGDREIAQEFRRLIK